MSAPPNWRRARGMHDKDHKTARHSIMTRGYGECAGVTHTRPDGWTFAGFGSFQ